MFNNANYILGNKIAYFREKYRIQHDFSNMNLNKAIKQIEQVNATLKILEVPVQKDCHWLVGVAQNTAPSK